jgi:hypothetical protein
MAKVITSTTTEEGDATFDSVWNHNPLKFECENFDKPSPSKGKGNESHTSQSGYTFPTFLLLAKYHNNVGLHFTSVLVTNSVNLSFMICLVHAHSAQTTCTIRSKWKVEVCN